MSYSVRCFWPYLRLGDWRGTITKILRKSNRLDSFSLCCLSKSAIACRRGDGEVLL